MGHFGYFPAVPPLSALPLPVPTQLHLSLLVPICLHVPPDFLVPGSPAFDATFLVLFVKHTYYVLPII
jgi:hypothetical protein